MPRRKMKIRPESVKGGYGAIPWVVLDSNSFKGASDKAKSLLFPLLRQHNGQNNGHLHLSKSWMAKQGYTCPAINNNARDELIERGLLVQTKLGGLNIGPHQFALTWLDVSNYVGLDISPKDFVKGKYSLCDLPPTPRRRQPVKK
jgi:hypothetical protein